MMTRPHPVRSTLTLLLGVLAVVTALYAMHFLGVAHAGPPGPDAAPAADASWDLVAQYGPLLGGLVLLYGFLQTFLSRQHWLAQGRTLAALTGAAMVLGAVIDWKLRGAPPAGILVAAFAAFNLVLHPTVQPAPARAAESGHARLTVLVVIALVAVGVGAACSSWRARTAAGVGAFLNCESPHVDAALLGEAKTVSIAGIEKWIGGDGHVDAAGLKAAAAPLKSDLMRCAFDAAVAAIATPKPKSAAQVSGLEVDGAELRATYAAVRVELAWPAQAVTK